MKMNLAELQAVAVAARRRGTEYTKETLEQTVAATGVKGLKVTPQGKVQVAIQHQLLRSVTKDGRVYRNFDCPFEAAVFKLDSITQLDKGVVPAGLGATPETQVQTVALTPSLHVMLGHYLDAEPKPYKDSERGTIKANREQLANLREGDLSRKWALSWVADMKAQRLAPGTIRKKVESLARALEWHYTNTIEDVAACKQKKLSIALRDMPPGYSNYEDDDEDRVEDQERDRRLQDGEQERIEGAIRGMYWRIPEKRGQGVPLRAFPIQDPDDFLVLFRLLVGSGMRLREAYRLQVGDVDLPGRTINLHKDRTKKGYGRQVAMYRWLASELGAYIAKRHGPNPTKTALVLPYWNGSKADLDKCSGRLVARFRTLFRYVGSEGLCAHDLRHEGISRFMELRAPDGRYVFDPAKVMRMSGHKTMQQFRRYWNMRPTELAELMDAAEI